MAPQRAYSWYRHQSTGLLVAGRQCPDHSRDLRCASPIALQIPEEIIKHSRYAARGALTEVYLMGRRG